MSVCRQDPREPASWGAPDVVAQFWTDGFTDQGEQLAFAALDATYTSGRVLDLGVGGGRTTALLQPGSAHYVGVDSSAAMVALARSRHPDADIRYADARQLGADYPDDGFDLVVFSFNGIDAVDHPGHAAVLAETYRVLRPGGIALFSTLNIEGPSFDERPWRLPAAAGIGRGKQVARRVLLPLRAARHPRTQLLSVRNYARTSRLSCDGDGWSLCPMRAHEFRFLVHFATIGATITMARDAGLEVQRIWTSSGDELNPGTEHSTADYFHYLTRKPLTESS